MRYTKQIVAAGVGAFVLVVGGVGAIANNKITRVEPVEFHMPEARQQIRNKIVTTTVQVVQAEIVKKQNVVHINRSDSWVDNDGDGVCDNVGAGTGGGNWVDNDGDGVCDNVGAGAGAGAGAGGGNWVDNDGDGVCDNVGIGTGTGTGTGTGNSGNRNESGNAGKGRGSGNGLRGNGGGRR